MKESIRTIEHPELGKVRVATDEQGQMWYCVRDLCDILGYTNPTSAIQTRIAKGLMTKADTTKFYTPSPALFTNRTGISVLTAEDATIRSKKATAVPLRAWLLSQPEQEPTLRSNYGPQQEELDFNQTPTATLSAQCDVQTFEHPQFGIIRTVTDEHGNMNFNAKDVCDILGYARPNDAIRYHVDLRDVRKLSTPTEGGLQFMLYLNESGLNSLILDSKRPEALEIRHWITSEVMPSVLRTGIYATEDAIKRWRDDPATLIQVLTEYSVAQQRWKQAEQRCEALQERYDTQQQQLQRLKELNVAQLQLLNEQEADAKRGRAISVSSRDMQVGVFAKFLAQSGVMYKGKPIGRNGLFEILRNMGLCYKCDGHNIPTQRAIDMEIFRVKLEPIEQLDGEFRPVTYITPKGQEYLLNKFLSDQSYRA